MLTSIGGVFDEDGFYAVEDYGHVLIEILQIVYWLGVELLWVQVEHCQERLYRLRGLQQGHPFNITIPLLKHFPPLCHRHLTHKRKVTRPYSK